MITPEKAQQDYRDALAALQQSAFTPEMSSAERMMIRDAIRELTAKYLDQLEAEISALTGQYASFISSMTGVIESLKGGATPVSVLNRLTAIVTNGAQLIEAATPLIGARAFGGPRAPVRLPNRPRKTAARRAVGRGASAEPLRVLCVHGVGHQEKDPAFENTWRDAITAGLTEWTFDRTFQIEFVAYDDLFAADPPSAFEVAAALVKLGASGIFHGIGDLFHRRRGFGDLAESVRWTAGMVVQWAENDRLRAAARKRVLDHTRKFEPHVVLAHSLGTLLSYDAFRRSDGQPLIAKRTFVTFGSQIGNPFVRSTLGGRIEPLPGAAQWFHLFNPHDNAFTSPLRIPGTNFEQVDASFDIDGMLDHDAREYLRHPNTVNVVWHALAIPPASAPRDITKSAVTLTRLAAKTRPAKITKPARRALLVGINDYPNEADRLHQKAIGQLFDEERDAITVMKWKEILDLLEDATDACEDVANLLENIVVKHG